MGLFDSLPRRKRQVVWTILFAVVFVAAALAFTAAFTGSGDTYTGGDGVEGLTSTLARGLPDDPPDVVFTDVTAEAGIAFDQFGGRRSSQLPEDMGSGAAWGDYDNDGWPDLFIVAIASPLGGSGAEASPTGGARSRLFRNLGDGRFDDVTESAGIDHAELGMGAAWADYDGDGWRDLVVTAYGGNRLYRNRGDGTFSDVTSAAGLARDIGFWTGAAWGDYDRDGDPDLYVTGYAQYTPGANAGVNLLQYEVEVPASLNPSSYRPERNLLYRNEGDGTFAEVAVAAGVDGVDGRSLSGTWADFDGDGWLDLYVANDVSDNALYINRADGTFENVSHAALVADYRGAMGLGVGDWDEDGDPDLFITHWIAQENALFSNRLSDGAGSEGRPLQFLDEADRYGLGQIALDFVGWGTSFIDYDNDGRLDLFVANGSTFQQEDSPHLLEPMVDQLFWNRGPDEGFFDVSGVSGDYFGEARVGRGAAFADYDLDGDMDAIVVNHGEAPSLLRNDGGDAGAWLAVALPADPVGARVRVVSGGRTLVRWLGAQSSYLSQNGPVMHVGLGDASSVDSLEITWPDGHVAVWTDVSVRRRLRPGRDGELTDLGGGTATIAAGLDDRERVRRFWEVFRAATRSRIDGALEDAERRYAEAHGLDPEHEDTLYYLGGVRAELGRPAEAIDAIRMLVEVNPRSGRGWVRLGALLSCPDTGAPTDLDGARQAFEAAQAINREQVGPALWLGFIGLLSGDVASAAGRFDTVLGTDPGNVAAGIMRGYAAWAQGDRDVARARLFGRRRGASRRAVGGGRAARGRHEDEPGTLRGRVQLPVARGDARRGVGSGRPGPGVRVSGGPFHRTEPRALTPRQLVAHWPDHA